MKKILLVSGIVIVIGILILILKPFGKNKPAESDATKISTAVVKKGNLTITVNSTGVVEPILTVELKSKASGEIIDISVEEGDKVFKGQLIARLDTTTTKNDYDQAAADLKVAEKALSQSTKEAERQRQLFEQKLISELDYENALLTKEQANSNLVRAKTTLENAAERFRDTIVKSPIDGIVLKKYVTKGQIIASGISTVSGGTTLATLADLSKAYISTSVDEVDIGQIQIGQEATVIAESYPDKEFAGRVLRIHPLAEVSQNVTTFNVTTEVDNSEDLLMAGMNANVEIIAGSRRDVLLVPRSALTDARSIVRLIGSNGGGPPSGRRDSNDQREGQGNRQREGGPGGFHGGNTSDSSGMAKAPSKVVIVVNNGKQEPKQIELGLANFEQAEILSGLNEGDTVLTTVTSKALLQREDMLNQMKNWSQIPGMQRQGR